MLVISALILVHLTDAQAQKVSRIRLLFPGSLSYGTPNIEAFREGLRELGYVEGKNIIIEYRYAEVKLNRLLALAAELMHLKVDS
jgi:putative ABC transport system substrate-binding protein